MRILLFLLVIALPALALGQQADARKPVPQVQVFGTVTDANTGKPIYEVTVEHYDLDGKRWSMTVSNSEGKYALFVPSNAPFELRVAKENGYARFSLKVDPRGDLDLHRDLFLVPK